MKFTRYLLAVLILTGCSLNRNVTVMHCDSVVEEKEEEFIIYLKPNSVTRGEIQDDMLRENGMLDYSLSIPLDAKAAPKYIVTLKKVQEREGIYKNAPLNLIYNMKFEGVYD